MDAACLQGTLSPAVAEGRAAAEERHQPPEPLPEDETAVTARTREDWGAGRGCSFSRSALVSMRLLNKTRNFWF